MAGMTLVDRHNEPIQVINQSLTNDIDTVFNIQVQDSETYHIGELGIWVHNAQCCDFTNKYGSLDSHWFDASGDAHWINPLNGQYEKIPDGAKVAVDHVLPQNYINSLLGFDKLL
jgi:filamentous hemagglutinin